MNFAGGLSFKKFRKELIVLSDLIVGFIFKGSIN